MRLAPPLLAPLAVLALVGCGTDTPDVPTAEPTSLSAVQPSPFEAGPELGSEGRPAPGTCEPLPLAGDGVYAVADAGTVTMIREGDEVTLDDVRALEGWEAETVADSDREVEVEFRGEDTEIDFEAEFDEGRLIIEICADDD